MRCHPIANEPSPTANPSCNRCRASFAVPDDDVRRRRAGFARSDRHHRTSPMPPMDTDRIPTEPTTDHEPPNVTSLTPGPSQAPTSPAAGRGRRTALIGAVVGIALVATFSAGIGVGQPASSPPQAARPAPPRTLRPPRRPDRVRAHQGGLGHHPPRVRRPRQARRPGAHLRRDRWHDRGGRRHRSHRLHDPRGTRAAQRLAVAARTSASGSASTRPRRACRASSASSRDSPAEAAGLKVGDVIVAVDGQDDRRQDRSTRSPRWVRGEAGHDRSRSPSGPTAPARSAPSTSSAPTCPIEPVSWTHRPGHHDGPHPPRPVLRGRRRRHRRRPSRTRAGAGRRPDRPRPARQSRWLRQRGGRRRQPVPVERRRLPRAQRRG